MKPIPKFTSGMFKKKVKRYGAASPKMPRVPKPRMKKFQVGGPTDDLVPRSMLPEQNAAELAIEAADMERYAREKGPPRRYRSRANKKPKKDRYAPTEIVLSGKEAAKEEAEEAEKQRDFERRLRDIEKRRREEQQRKEYEEYKKSQMPQVRTARAGGEIKKYRAGGSIDGCAKRGKTRGKYI